MLLKERTDYTDQERGRLRRVARREVPVTGLTAPPDRAKGKPFYATIPPRVARTEHASAFEAGLTMAVLAAEDLGIDMPRVRWLLRIDPAQAGAIAEAGKAEAYGLTRLSRRVTGLASGVVSLMLLRSPRATARTAAHEMRHEWQRARGILERMTYQEQEDDATGYAEDAMRRLWSEVERVGPAVTAAADEHTAPISAAP